MTSKIGLTGCLAEARDEVIDTIAYLRALPAHLWQKPHFYPLGDGLSEVRCKVNELNKTIRLYGFFWPEVMGRNYSFLLGTEKKTKNPKHHIAEARKRQSRVEQKVAFVHAFYF